MVTRRKFPYRPTTELQPVFDNTTAITVLKYDKIKKRAADSAAMLPYWDMTDDIVGGLETLKKNANKYIPKFPQEEQDNYTFRVGLAKVTNIYDDIVETLSAKPFERQLDFILEEDEEAPTSLAEFVKNVDGNGSTWTEYASEVFYNGINSAVHWILIDYPENTTGTTETTVADNKRKGNRPYWSHILGRNVLEAKVEIIGGEEVLTYIRILEPGDKERIRVFERDNGAGEIKWELYEKTDKPAKDTDSEYKRIGGGSISIDVIPVVWFATGRRKGKTFEFKPPMKAAAELQIQLFRDETSLNWIKHLTAFPMLAGNGVSPERNESGVVKKIRTGPNVVLYAPQNKSNGRSGSWSYVEPSAQSLEFLKTDIEDTKKDLRELGRQPLTSQSGNLTVITTAVAAGKARSTVKNWCLDLKNTLEKALRISCKWMNEDEKIVPPVDIYTEFDSFIEGKDVAELITLRKNNEISQSTLWKELKRRDILSDDFNGDRELQKLLDELESSDFEDDVDDDVDDETDPKKGNDT